MQAGGFRVWGGRWSRCRLEGLGFGVGDGVDAGWRV
jgi:hypothetical protein